MTGVAATRAFRPATPAAPAARGGLLGTDSRAVRTAAEDLAIEMEGRRRSITLGGSLLLIPAAGGVALAVAALAGVPAIWLPLLTLTGLSAGPALTTLSLAGLNLVGGPLVKRRFNRRSQRLGLPADQIEQTWRDAMGIVDASARARLGRARP